MEISRKAVCDEFSRDEIVYLSPYSSNGQFILCCYLFKRLLLVSVTVCMLSAVLQEVKSSVVYVVGGVVDKVCVKV